MKEDRPLNLKKVLIVGNLEKPNSNSVIENIQKSLGISGIHSTLIPTAHFSLREDERMTEIADHFHYRDYDLIIAVGGDGTFLYAARSFLLLNIPIIGVNLGRVGFMMDINPEDFDEALKKMIDGHYRFRNRMMLDVKVRRKNQTRWFLPFLNDAVISKGSLSRMIETEIYLDRELCSKYRSDGLIISTPTGSTAYNLSAGGPILNQNLDATIITPICPHTLSIRPIVTGKQTKLNILYTAGEDDVTLTIDGQEDCRLKKEDEILISFDGHYARTLDLSFTTFFHTFRKKLDWHIDSNGE